ncbi:NAD(P)-dependent dehydrogenase (short-subunit alcohol dehydrogenase family) [Rhodococcus rhodochrous J45]|uniref:NAD(P)-dependent dehydrogenase (Short-subunit alcohol dehydrogenase family) n=1 Tax=Rhodococcus rhodochrous J45 TaxID=935266 RepID=A0A562DKA1_RHORH|nr:SDR family oxidoreductase [Rhodococcus rhodochrous]TWH10108.1 NAD(P)-dependent dehydrogenase (short-subunit alcohol dehydrogenase family) [Rhodococcus rhodochrous J45]
MTYFEGKTAIVAAGAKNLGGLVSETLAQQGANIVIHHHGESSAADARRTLKAVEATGSRAISVSGDLTRPANVKSLFTAAMDAFGSVDIAVNTVGKVLRKPILETTEADYDTMFDVNAKSAYFFIKEAGTHLREGGRIITIVTSLLAAFTDGYSTYAGGKSPVEHFTRAAAKEFADRSITVNAVAPGPMDTPFFYPQETSERVEFHKSQAIGGRLTHIEDIVPLITFLAGDGGWITGQTIFANGGYTTR